MRFVVTGRVQGVGFRYATRQMARRLGLSGWVANRPGGDVETCARGDAASLAKFEAWLWEGPAHARVEAVAVVAHADTDDDNDGGVDNGDFIIRV